MTKDLFTQQNKGIIGHGGYKCPCCNDYHGRKRKKLNRIKRRKLKHCTEKEIKNLERID